MERMMFQMEDPMFSPGEFKTAKIAITVIPSGLSGSVTLWMAIDAASPPATPIRSAIYTSTGLSQIVSIIPVTMPTVPGSYKVFIDLKVGSVLLAAYVGTEDIVIPGGSVTSLTWA